MPPRKPVNVAAPASVPAKAIERDPSSRPGNNGAAGDCGRQPARDYGPAAVMLKGRAGCSAAAANRQRHAHAAAVPVADSQPTHTHASVRRTVTLEPDSRSLTVSVNALGASSFGASAPAAVQRSQLTKPPAFPPQAQAEKLQPPPPPIWTDWRRPRSPSMESLDRCYNGRMRADELESPVRGNWQSPLRRLAKKFDSSHEGTGTSSGADPNINRILKGKLVELGAGDDVLVQQRNPKSPLFAARSFEQLHMPPDLLKVIYQMGWMRPSKIQETVVPLLLLDPPQSVVAQAQSGTGKTAAFILCMLRRVDPSINAPQAICVAPTFELARQIYEVVDVMANKLGNISARCVVRQDDRQRAAGRPQKVTEHVVVGTPGKTNDFVLKYGALDVSHVRVLVLDEADVMLSTHGHIDLTRRLVNAIETKQAGGRKLQIAMFSATYDDEVIAFAKELIPEPKEFAEVSLRRNELPLENVLQFFVTCADRDAKFTTICALYSSLTIGSSIIFCRTRASSEWLAEKMTERRHKVAVLHGQMPMEDRYAKIQQFASGRVKVLITTNLCSRGIDVPHCSVVINYDLPVLVECESGDEPNVGRATVSGPDFDSYIHRIGRTGRFGKKGLAVNLIGGKQELEHLEMIERYFDHRVLPLDPHDEEEMTRVDDARRIDLLLA